MGPGAHRNAPTHGGQRPALIWPRPAYRSFVVPSTPTPTPSGNEGNTELWDPDLKAYLSELKAQKKPYSYRYVGALVGDFHRTLCYGGIWCAGLVAGRLAGRGRGRARWGRRRWGRCSGAASGPSATSGILCVRLNEDRPLSRTDGDRAARHGRATGARRRLAGFTPGRRLYPPDAKAPSGKARLLYEVAPMSMIAEQAGGIACVGPKADQRVLDIVPQKVGALLIETWLYMRPSCWRRQTTCRH